MRWTRAGRLTSGAKADERNRVVPIPRRWDQVGELAMSALGPTRRVSPAMEANKPGTPGRSRISRKPLRRECRCFGVPVAFSFACEPRVRLVHPALPAPSIFEGGDRCITRAFPVAGKRSYVCNPYPARKCALRSIQPRTKPSGRCRTALPAAAAAGAAEEEAPHGPGAAAEAADGVRL
jgi:hypothetical protein